MTTLQDGGDMTWPRLSLAVSPTINLNGESGQSHMEKLSEARRAMDAALKAVAECYPHGRDYQTVGDPTVHNRAHAQHDRRMYCLRRIDAELETIEENIHKQMQRGAK